MSEADGSPPDQIRRLWPVSTPGLDGQPASSALGGKPAPSWPLSDAQIVESLRSSEPVLRVNFVSSVDGAVTHDGRSGGLSNDADKRYFELLRRVSDVVLVGAGTVRDEGYGGMRVSDESARWRVADGMPPHPVFAIVSGSLDLDPESGIFTNAPVRPIVFTTSQGVARDGERAAALAAVADVVVADVVADSGADASAGAARVHGPTIVRTLHERGLGNVLCEGGPHLFGSLLADGVVDELFLTVSPTLEAGDAARITAGELAATASLTLASVLASGSTLLLRYATT